LIIRSKIPLYIAFSFSILSSGCSLEIERKKLKVESHKKQITSKLRLFGKSKSIKTEKGGQALYSDKSNRWFNGNINAQKIYLVDLNGDQTLDLVTLKEKYSSPEVYLFDLTLNKFSLSKSSMFPSGHKASFLYFDDVNKDNIIDVYSGHFYLNVEYSVPPAQILLGKKEGDHLSFELAHRLFSEHRPQSSLLALDVDQDGFLEFMQINWMGNNDGINQFYPLSFFSLKSTTVEIINKNNNILKSGASSWGGELCDINNDNILDILIANTSGHENFVLKGMNGHFESAHQEYIRLSKDEEGSGLMLGHGNTFGHICADFNNDGLVDVLAFEEKRQLQDSSRDAMMIHFQKLPTEFGYPFVSKKFPIGLKNYSIKRVVEFDMDNDGDLDLLLENTGFPPHTRLMLFENEQGVFKNITDESGLDLINPSGVNVGDLDGDGTLEVIVGQSKIRSSQLSGNLKIFKRRLDKASQMRSVQLLLDGQFSNSSAVGAIISIKTKTHQEKRIVNYMRGGAQGQRSRLVHFGIGENISLRIEVIWPNKKVGKKNYEIDLELSEKTKVVTLCESGLILNGKKLCKI
jgi:enediyne biosynthesis protein E4